MNNQNILGKPDAIWNSPYTQQGDCLIKKIGIHGVFNQEFEQIPDDAVEVKGNLVLKGQTNSHALYGGKFQLLTKDNVLFIRVTEPTVLDHVKDHLVSPVKAEHHAQWIPVGDYFHKGILEKDHIKNEVRQVID
jgi:hypothetical protein